MASGSVSSASSIASEPVGRLADDGQLGLLLDERLQRLQEVAVVVGDQHLDGAVHEISH
jgi:hypothetical protein